MSKYFRVALWWNILCTSIFSAAAEPLHVQCPTVNVDPIIQKGKRFFHSVTGEFFPVKGIAYHPRPNNGTLSIPNSVDFFTDEFRDLWMADLEYIKALGVNTIRIYAVDPSKSHDAFMCALQEAGIYVILELLADCEDCGIGPDEAPSCYPPSLKERGQWIINEFSKYTNTLLFSAGNEVTFYAQDQQMELNAPCQKKFMRDMRAYVNTCSPMPNSVLPRKVPIGMVNWDNQRTRQTLYFNCRTDPSDELETPEWYGLNSYQDCETAAVSANDLSGVQTLLNDFVSYNLSVPVIITEFGCRERFPAIGEFEAQRTWLQVDIQYSPMFIDQFAGAVAFEFSAEKLIVDTSSQGNPWPYYGFMKLNYGVGYYSPVDCNHRTIPCEYIPYPEFDVFSAKMAAVDTSLLPDIDAYFPTPRGIPVCPEGIPKVTDFTWPVDDEPGLPCWVVPTDPPTLEPSVGPPPTPKPIQSPVRPPNPSPTSKPSLFSSSTSTSATVATLTPTSSASTTHSLRPSPTMPTVPPTSKPTTVYQTIDVLQLFSRSPAPSGQHSMPTNPSKLKEDDPMQSTIPSSAGPARIVTHTLLLVLIVCLSMG
jgi:hypothetical protein